MQIMNEKLMYTYETSLIGMRRVQDTNVLINLILVELLATSWAVEKNDACALQHHEGALACELLGRLHWRLAAVTTWLS